MKKLVVATTNRGKLVEIEACLSGLDYQLMSLSDFENPPSVVEDAETFEGNARKKAIEILHHYGYPTLADDSGLEVDFLNGAPGVRSARFGAPGLDDKGRCEYLLEVLKDVPLPERGARFQTILIYATPSTEPVVFKGTLQGHISLTPAGQSGFGYDQVFVPDGMNQTVAELGPTIKNQISHRAKALQAFAAFIKSSINSIY